MRYSCNVKEVCKTEFYVRIGDAHLPVHYYFMPLAPFSHKYNYNSYIKDDVEIIKNPDNTWNFVLHNDTKTAERIWLYDDCKGVEFDNGLQQFLHDCRKRDGVIRYYVVSDKRQKRYISQIGKKLNSGAMSIND